MFKMLEIHLSKSICNCENCNLGWGFEEHTSSPVLSIFCHTCSTTLYVKDYKAIISLETPLPAREIKDNVVNLFSK